MVKYTRLNVVLMYTLNPYGPKIVNLTMSLHLSAHNETLGTESSGNTLEFSETSGHRKLHKLYK